MKCEKCGYESEDNKKIKIENEEFYICSICNKFLPSTSTDIENYLKEKINWQILETFRKNKNKNKNIKGMEEKAKFGGVVSRAPFGYKIESKELIPDKEKSLMVEEIFRTFLETNKSLNSLAKQFGFSVNGLKKILRNFTYIGKIKFAGQISEGKHEAIITPELFNKVQSKLEALKIR